MSLAMRYLLSTALVLAIACGKAGGAPPPPPAPTAVVLSLVNKTPTLSWAAPSGSAGIVYQVLRGSSASSLAVLDQTDTLSYLDTNASLGGTWFYAVRTVVGTSYSVPAASSPASVTLAPDVVSGVTAAGNCQSLALSWHTPAGATSYVLTRQDGSNPPLTIASGAAADSFIDTGLPADSTFKYAWTFSNAGGKSPSVSQTFTTPPTAPQFFNVYGTNHFVFAGDVQATMQWNAPSAASREVSKCSLLRGASPTGPFAVVAQGLPCELGSATDTGLQPNTTYWYSVTQANSAGTSCPAIPANGSTGAPGSAIIQGPKPAQVRSPMDGGQVKIAPYDLSQLRAAAVSVSADGDTLLQGEGSADGQFTIPGLTPGAPYYLSIYGYSGAYANRVIYAGAREIDIGATQMLPVPLVQTSTLVTVSASALVPWTRGGDHLELFSANAGLGLFVDQQGTEPAAGATQASIGFDLRGLGGLIDLTRGDVVTLTDIATVAGATPFPYQALTKSCIATLASSAAMAEGVPSQIKCAGDGTMSPVTMSTTTVNLARSKFKSDAFLNALKVTGAKLDTSAPDTFVVGAFLGLPQGAPVYLAQNPTLLSVGLDSGSGDVQENVTFGTSLPVAYGAFYEYDANLAKQAYSAVPTATCRQPAQVVESDSTFYRDILPSSGKLPPEISPPFSATSAPTISTLSQQGNPVQVSWTPAAGAHPPNSYTITLFRVDLNATDCTSRLGPRLEILSATGDVHSVDLLAFTTRDGSANYAVSVQESWGPDIPANLAQPLDFANRVRLAGNVYWLPQFAH